MTLRYILLISCILLVLGVAGETLLNMAGDAQLGDVHALRDVSLDEFTRNKVVARSVISILGIHDQSSYSEVKSLIYGSLSDNLRSSIFPTEVFRGAETGRTVVSVNSVGGDISEGSTHHFKVDTTITVAGGLPRGITFIVSVRHGIVFNIERV